MSLLSRKAIQERAKLPTESGETYCKYCDVDYLHPMKLKDHVFDQHYDSTRREMYEKEQEWMEARAQGFK